MQGAETATVGRIVHYFPYETPQTRTECQAAIVTGILRPGELVLSVFTQSGGMLHRDAHYRDPGEQIAGTWHWPERAPIS